MALVRNKIAPISENAKLYCARRAVVRTPLTIGRDRRTNPLPSRQACERRAAHPSSLASIRLKRHVAALETGLAPKPVNPNSSGRLQQNRPDRATR